MTDEDTLRMMVREAIASRLVSPRAGEKTGQGGYLPLAAHPSHFRYTLPGSGEACLIEPAVQCNHCGYCQSHGH